MSVTRYDKQWTPDGAIIKEVEKGTYVLHSDYEKLEKSKKTVNTSERLFDLVRYMRAELHGADLITDEEYAWISGGSSMANSPQGGSPSPRRLEEYDQLKRENKKLLTQRDELIAAAKSLCNGLELGMPCTNKIMRLQTAIKNATEEKK